MQREEESPHGPASIQRGLGCTQHYYWYGIPSSSSSSAVMRASIRMVKEEEGAGWNATELEAPKRRQGRRAKRESRGPV